MTRRVRVLVVDDSAVVRRMLSDVLSMPWNLDRAAGAATLSLEAQVDIFEGIGVLSAHAWPGNVRELQNVIEHLVAMSDDGTLRASDLPDSVRVAAGDRAAAPSLSLSGLVCRYERDLIEAALREAEGNRTRAAHALGISRENLVKKLRKHRLGGA